MTDAPDYKYVIVDTPPGTEHIRRITLNRPEARNALSNALRGELFDALTRADQDRSVRVMIIRGNEQAFSAGYDLKTNVTKGQPYYTAGGLANWPRHVLDGCFYIWDLSKPVIAQVTGYCLAGGMELAQSCDLIYVADDAKIGYPPVRSISPPDNQFFPWVMGMRKGMEMMLTGDSMTGIEAAACGFANASVPASELEAKVLEMAARVAKVPPDLQQFNKRSVHRQMDIMGIRAALRATTEIQALASFTETSQTWIKSIGEKGLTTALSNRDADFGDYRETGKKE